MRLPNFSGASRTRSTPRLAAAATLTLASSPLLMAAMVVMAGCNDAAAPASFKANSGQIQVLNGSGRTGQAEVFRAYLTERGFDVIEAGNARSWNYEHTLVLARTASDTIARHVAYTLGTDRLVHLQHPASLVEATVIIGKDYKEIMRTWSKTKKN